MENDKKYYWLRLKKDFFKRHDIRIIEAMPNGKDYILFYLKLLCESVDHDGNLRFNEEIPYNETMLSTITNTNVDIVKSAIDLFTSLNMMELMDDGTFYMNKVNEMIGSSVQDEHTRESTRLRVRAYRERQKQAQIEQNRYSNATCNGEIEKELEIDIEKDKDIKENNKENTEQSALSTSVDVVSEEEMMFNEFWKLYPKKIAKQQCLTAYRRIPKLKTTHKLIMDALNILVLSEQWKKANGQFIPNPLTFIHQRRWEDVNVASNNYTNEVLEDWINDR